MRMDSHPFTSPQATVIQTLCLVKELGAVVDAADNDGDTPLHHAAANGRTCTVRFMVTELGAAVAALNQVEPGCGRQR